MKAIIVDIDGTLAHRKDRGPYDLSKVKHDYVDEKIKELVNFLDSEYFIVIVSGREDICEEDTIDWLEENDIEYDALFMREKGDIRPDYVIKAEIYKNKIKNKHEVLFVLDDRDQTVKGWRDLGLKCFQVAEGNF